MGHCRQSAAAQPGVRISPDTVVLKWLNATATMTAEVRDAEGTLVAQPGLTWKSLNPEIATADNMGVITAKSVGMALIVATAACCDQADTAYTRVYQAVDSVAVEPESVSLPPESSVQLSAAALDRGGSLIEDATFEFRSANESVARVSEDGVVTTTESFGTTTITAASGGQSYDVTVSVRGEYPNEPAGFVPWFEHDWQTWPNGRAELMFASGVGMIKASDYTSDAAEAFLLVDDPTAPHGKGKSLRHKLRDGQPVGSTSGTFDLFSPKPGAGTSQSYRDQVKLRSVYRSHWVYFEPDPVTNDFMFGIQHMRTFWWNRSYGSARGGNVSLTCPNTFVSGVGPQRTDTWKGPGYWYYSDDGLKLAYNNMTLRVGVWYHVEYLWESEGNYNEGTTETSYSNEDGPEGLNNGRMRTWVDGVLVQDHTIRQHVRAPLANDHFGMVFLSGSSAWPRIQDDFIRFGDIYVSGIVETWED
jgi:hypothetical protein